MASHAFPHQLTEESTPSNEIAHRSSSFATVGIYAATVFIGSSLVFLVQPMIAKMLLPNYGGSPSVWNTSLVFFQAALLIGYAWAHVISSKVPVARQPIVQILFMCLPLLLLPFELPGYVVPPDDAPPALWLILVLGVVVGLPYVAVTTTSPLLQRWLAASRHHSGRDPYWLYAAGNAGSLLALLTYPFVIEPYLSLEAQSDLWFIVYCCYFALFAVCAVTLRMARGTVTVEGTRECDAQALVTHRGTWRLRFQWILLAFIPSSLMVGATTFLSTDVASVPLLWIVPLSLYLLTFIFAFSIRNPLPVSRTSGLLGVAALASVMVSPNVGGTPILVVVLAHLALMLLGGILCHSRLAEMRPAPARLTEFFLLMSVGGVLGGAFNALIAPVIFNQIYEYPLVIVLVLLVRPNVLPLPTWSSRELKFDLELPLLIVLAGIVATVLGAGQLAIVAACCAMLVFLRRPRRLAIGVALMLLVLQLGTTSTLLTERTFFGVHRVIHDGNKHTLVHGTTIHGVQNHDPVEDSTPLSYYSHVGPLGQVFEALQASEPFNSVGVIGLGIGTVAAYGEAGQQMTFFEIDAEVAAIASNPEYFTYLKETEADASIIIGDGRLELESVPDGSYDLLIVDAFSSDSIPAHLLTKEAVELYFQKVATDGVVAFNVSNRNMDLAPVLAGISKELGTTGYIGSHRDVSKSDMDAGVQASEWVVVSSDPSAVRPLTADSMWTSLENEASGVVWTDQFSNIVSTIKWFD